MNLRDKILNTARIGVLGIATLTFTGCNTETEAIDAAKSAGWSNVHVTETNYLNFTCGDEETAYRITGKNPANKNANATVCCGYTLTKGCTIRY